MRAFASMRAVRLFLRAQAMINFLMRAASTSSIFRQLESLFFHENFILRQAIWLTPSKQDNTELTANYAHLIIRLLQNYLT